MFGGPVVPPKGRPGWEKFWFCISLALFLPTFQQSRFRRPLFPQAQHCGAPKLWEDTTSASSPFTCASTSSRWDFPRSGSSVEPPSAAPQQMPRTGNSFWQKASKYDSSSIASVRVARRDWGLLCLSHNLGLSSLLGREGKLALPSALNPQLVPAKPLSGVSLYS